MTNLQDDGSSLSQTIASESGSGSGSGFLAHLLSHSHFHGHSHSHSYSHSHNHNHNHEHLDDDSQDGTASVDQHGDLDDSAAEDQDESDSLELRQLGPADLKEERTVVLEQRGDDDSYITKVVQTVSVYQIVDGNGSPIDTQTVFAKPTTVVIDPSLGVTLAVSVGSIGATVAAGDGSLSVNLPSAPTALPPMPASTSGTTTPSTTVVSPPPPPSSLSSSTTPPSSTVAAHPTVGGAHNSTNPYPIGNSSVPVSAATAPSNSSVYFPFAHTSPSKTATSASSDSSHYSSYYASYNHKSSSTVTHLSYTSTAYSSDGWYSGSPTTSGSSEPTTTGGGGSSGGSSAVDLSPQQKQVIGGVVGSVAGVAIFALLVMMLLRWKRKGGFSWLSAGHGASGTRSITSGPGGGAGDGSGAAMAEGSASLGVTAALASLVGKRQPPEAEASGSGERGFYRVSGRKLPSVLTAGGDGYTDPRDSVRSGDSDYYRGSQAFEPSNGMSTRLALGSPMRPVSGVPVMRPGPGRTPMASQNPFADPPHPPPSSPLPTPPPPRTPPTDPLGRSLTGQTGSRASSSRFQEGL